MKFAHFADLHLDTAFKWAPKPIARARRQALRDALTSIVAVAIEENVDAVFCAGDLYEQDSWTPDTGAFLRLTFESLNPIPVFLAPGNHDWFGPNSLYRQTHWSDNVHLFTEDRLRPVELTAGLTLWGGAHRAPAGTGDFLDRGRVDGGDVNLALFHGSERGGFPAQGEGKEAHAPFNADEVPEKGFMHAFCGHYHTPKAGFFHTYPGNPEPLAFGELGERGLVISTISDAGLLDRKWRSVAQTQVQDVRVDITGCASSLQVRTRVVDSVAGLTGLARIVFEGEVGERLDLSLPDLPTAVGQLDAVTYKKGDLRTSYDLEAIARETTTVRGQFVLDVLKSGLPADEQRRVVETGLRALGGRLDLEVI